MLSPGFETTSNTVKINQAKNETGNRSIRKKIKELDKKIEDVEKRLPAHSVKPPIMTELFELEDEREALLKKISEMKGET
jgi:hypothetical protein